MKKSSFLCLLSLFISGNYNSQTECNDNSDYWGRAGNLITGNNGNYIGTCNDVDLNFKSRDTTRMVIQSDGRIFFGKRRVRPEHIHANSFLQIDGKVACKELVVIDPHKWADYVFRDNYQLMPLPELETFYRLHKRLPDVPGEADVMKNGINTAEMDALLLQKIEELTLYLVEMNKKLEALAKENEILKNKLDH